MRTVRDPLADGLYVDGGAEHFTRPGYELFWGYVKEFNLTAFPYRRRESILRYIDGSLHTEEMLADPKVLSGFGIEPAGDRLPGAASRGGSWPASTTLPIWTPSTTSTSPSRPASTGSTRSR